MYILSDLLENKLENICYICMSCLFYQSLDRGAHVTHVWFVKNYMWVLCALVNTFCEEFLPKLYKTLVKECLHNVENEISDSFLGKIFISSKYILSPIPTKFLRNVYF